MCPVNTRNEIKWKGTKQVGKWTNEIAMAIRSGFTSFYPNAGPAPYAGAPGRVTWPTISGLEMPKVRFLV
jgi:hypothetical protein